MLKVCVKCGMAKPRGEFNADLRAADLTQTYCKTCQGKVTRDSYLERKYGVSPADYDRMLAKQEGRCAICKAEPTLERRLDVDHSHSTGKVRGLLCSGCNKGLGFFKEDVAVMHRAITYLVNREETYRV